MKQCDGGITIFFSMLMLSLMIFSCTIVDATRIQMMESKGLRASRAGADALMTYYDSVLWEQYGIYAVPTRPLLDATDWQETANVTMNPEKVIQESGLENGNSQKEKLSSLMKGDIALLDLAWRDSLVKNTSGMKRDIVGFMTRQLPFMMTESVLEKMSIFSKSTKTMSILEEKADIQSQMGDLEAHYRQIEYLIEGLKVDTKSGEATVDGSLNYVKRILPSEFAMMPIYTSEEIPSPVICQQLNANCRNIVAELNSLNQFLEGAKNSLQYAQTAYLAEMVKVPKEQDFSGAQFQIDQAKTYMSQYFDPKWTQVKAVLGTSETGSLGAIHQEILNELQVMENLGAKMDDSMVQLETEIAAHQEDYVPEVKVQIKNDFANIRCGYGMESTEYVQVDNLAYIKAGIQNNVMILNNIQQPLQQIVNVEQTLKSMPLLQSSVSWKDSTLSEQFELTMTSLNQAQLQLNNAVELIKTQLSQYQRNFVFNYGEMKGTTSSVTEESCKETSESWDPSALAPKEATYIEAYTDPAEEKVLLPSEINKFSELSEGGKSEAISGFTPFKIEPEKLLTDLKDTFLINEYILGMFNNVTTSEKDRTLLGYDLNLDATSSEVEYVITGKSDEKVRKAYVIGSLYALRTGCNMIHLVTNPEKRLMISSLSSAVAGWWSLGVGAMILSAAITLFWAMAESMVDIQLLLSGERVPFIKTTTTWYTSIDGNWSSLIDKGGEALIKLSESKLQELKSLGMDELQNFEENISDQTMNLIEEQSTSLYDQGMAEIDAILEEKINALDTVLNKGLDQIRNQKLEEIDLSTSFSPSDPFYPVAVAAVEELKSAYSYWIYSDAPEGIVYQKLIELKTKIYEKIDTQLAEIKNQVVVNLQNQVKSTLSSQFNQMNQMIEQQVDKGLEVGTQQIESWVSESQKNLKENVFKSNTTTSIGNPTTSGTPNTSGNTRSQFVPTFSYKDYLRLFLLNPALSEDVKLIRTLDLIQLNLQRTYQDESISLSTYMRSLKITSTLSYEKLFMSHPFLGQVKGAVTQFQMEVEVAY